MRKIFFYLIIFKKIFLLSIYPIFIQKGKVFALIRKNIENYLIFQPSKLRAKRIKRGLLKKIKPQRFINEDRVKLYGWFIPPQSNNPTFLHLHGQAESILSHQDLAIYCLENGYGLFMLSYRGHYKSGGNPSERGLYRDAQAAMKQLKKLGVDEDKVILWGHSLGTVVALETAIYYKVMGVIIQSPIKDIKSAAVDVYNFYCKRLHLNIMAKFAKKYIFMMRFIQKMDNVKKIKAVKCPVLLMHSKTDRIASYQNSIELAEYNPLAQLFISEHGTHWNADWCMKRVFEFVKSLE